MGRSISNRGRPQTEAVDANVKRSERDLIVETLIARVEDVLDYLSIGTISGRANEPSIDNQASASQPFAELQSQKRGPTGFPEGRAAFAREMTRQRQRRAAHLPAKFFAEPAWDMLLDLYAAHYEGKAVSAFSLSIAANVPTTTAWRVIQTMSDEGCLVRRRDPSDGRRTFVTLSDTARKHLDDYFDELMR